MTLSGSVRVAVFAALIAGQAVAADACSCPKGQQVEKHGTLSQVRHDVPLPPPLPPEKAVVPAAGGTGGGG